MNASRWRPTDLQTAATAPHVVGSPVAPPGVGWGSPQASDAAATVVEIPGQPPPSAAPAGPERRKSGARRRAGDRLLDRATQPYPQTAPLGRIRDAETTMLFVDDDLRETALAIGRIESYLVGALQTLERPDLRRADVVAVANDTAVLDHLDQLNETVESLRRRLGRLASRMR